ncbi:hypothetical protein D3C80_1933850 [compost metagenome]
MYPDVFILCFQTVNSFCRRGIDFTDHNRKTLAGATRTGQIIHHRFAAFHHNVRFFECFAAGDLFDRFALFNDTGDHLQKPRGITGIQCRDADLFD